MISIYHKKIAKAFEKKYGISSKNININVKSMAEMIRALTSQFEGFIDLLKQCGDDNFIIKNGKDLESAKPVKDGYENIIYKDTEWFLYPCPQFGIAPFFIALGKIILLSLVSFGVSYLLAPKPDNDKYEFHKFSGLLNLTKSGTTIPVLYGECWVSNPPIISVGTRLETLDNDITTTKYDILYLISHGEIEGPANGNNIYKSTYVNGTQVKADNGDTNVAGVVLSYTNGTSGQNYLKGFDKIRNEISVNTPLTKSGGAVSRTITDSDVDNVFIKLTFPGGLYWVTDKGEHRQKQIDYKVTVTPDNGAGEEQTTLPIDLIQEGLDYYYGDGRTFDAERTNFSVTRKVLGEFSITSYIDDLSQYGDGPYVIKVYRITDDHETDTKTVDAFIWDTYTEITDVKLTYPNYALVGVTIDARSFDGSLPEITFKMKGKKVQIPSNYNPETLTYTGVWDGSFTTDYTNNGAWCLYDILTNETYGFGNNMSSDYIDKWTLYSISQYNDTQVSHTLRTKNDDGSYTSSEVDENRYTFNGAITQQESIIDLCRRICSTMNCFPYYDNSIITFVQDKARTPNRIACTSNVVDGYFLRTDSNVEQLKNQITMSYIDDDNFGADNIVVAQDDDSISLYGPQTIKATAEFCNSKAQAQRKAEWLLYTNQNQNKLITFTGGLEWADAKPGEIIYVQDAFYADLVLSTRIVSSTTTSITVDETITIESGVDYTLYIPDSTSRILIEKELTNPNGDYTTLYWSGALDEAPEAGLEIAITTSNVALEEYQIVKVSQEEDYTYAISCLNYDSGKYDYIEEGIVSEPRSYTNLKTGPLDPPDNIFVQPYAYIDGDSGNRKYGLLVSWTKPDDPRVLYFEIRYKYEEEEFIQLPTKYTDDFCELDNLTQDGNYKFIIRSVSATSHSIWAYSNTVDFKTYSDVTAPGIPQNLHVHGGDTEFAGRDCVVEWDDSTGSIYIASDSTAVVYTDNGSQTYTIAGVKYYKVEIYSIGNDLKRTAYTKNKNDRTFTYTYEMNVEDFGTPTRSFYFKVYTVDIYGEISDPAYLTVSNPAPDFSSQTPTATGGYGNVKLSWTVSTDLDIQYYKIYADNSTPPTTDVANVAHPDHTYNYHNASYGVSYYFKVVPYDWYGAGTASQICNGTSVKIPAESVDIELENHMAYSSIDSTSTEDLQKLYDTANTTSVDFSINGDWSWVEVDFGMEKQIDAVMFKPTSACQVCFAISRDQTDWIYAAGDGSHELYDDGDVYRLTGRSTFALAKTNYLNITSVIEPTYAFFPNGINFIARYCRIYINTTTTSEGLYILRFDDQLTAEKIYARYLSAICADIGILTSGTIQSSDFSATEGMQIDLNSKSIIMRKSGVDLLNVDSGSGDCSITITSASGYDNISDKPTALSDINSGEGSKLTGIAAGATVGATWGTNLSSIPGDIFYTGSNDLDDIAEGSNYGKVAKTDISAGHILLSTCSGNLDNISNGSSYGKVALSDISAGHIVLATCTGDLDDITNGSTYEKVRATVIDSGYIDILRASADENERININPSSIDFYSNNISQLSINGATPEVRLGRYASGYPNLKLTSSQLQFKNYSTVMGYIDNHGWHSQYQPAFLTTCITGGTNKTGDGTTWTIEYDNEVYDQASNITTTTFSCPTTGRYLLTIQVYCSGTTAAHYGYITLFTSNRSYTQYISARAGGVTTSVAGSFTVIADMDINDHAYCLITMAGGSKTVDVVAYFSGILLA